jgi:hypothetical protein
MWIYRTNSKLERAKWMTNLYEKEGLKTVRNKLDCDSDESEIDDLVCEETQEFTDYLNFFEYIGKLKKLGQLSDEDIRDLFGYYLDCLKRHRSVRDYISQREKGFEELERLLDARNP